MNEKHLKHTFYKNELYELEEEINDLKVEIGMKLLNEMVDSCREKVTELTGIVF